MRLYAMLFFLCLSLFLTACGFHLQGAVTLPALLHRLYLQTNDPYGTLARSLKQYLKLSHVEIATDSSQASTVLTILRDEISQELLSVSGTQQTRQYNLKVTVEFDITDSNGRSLIGPQTITESRIITVQSNQILGSSNEANLLYQQMRRTIAYILINRIASNEVSAAIMKSISPSQSSMP